MSWAAHDPEGWTEVCIRGILRKMDARHIRNLTQPDPELDRECLEEIATGLNGYNVFMALLDWASDEVADAEADHFAGMGE